MLNVDFEENKNISCNQESFFSKIYKILSKINNPYEKNNSSDKILKVIKTINLKKLKTKKFFWLQILMSRNLDLYFIDIDNSIKESMIKIKKNGTRTTCSKEK